MKKATVNFLSSMVIFGTIGIFVEYIDLPSGVIASFRGITGAIVILAVMLLSGKKIDFKSVKKKIKVLVASGVAIGFNWILLFEAYKFTGIPVATVAINGGANAALLCAQILAVEDKELAGKLDKMRKDAADVVLKKDAEVMSKLNS